MNFQKDIELVIAREGIDLKSLGAKTMSLSYEAQEAWDQAICQKGKRRGLLKKIPPPTTTSGYAAWQAIISVMAPARVSVGGILFMSSEDKAIFEEISTLADNNVALINATLQAPYEFNLFHQNGRI